MFATITKSERQARYLSQAVQLEEAVNPSIIRSTMLTVSVAIIAFLGWAAVTNINEVARTPGEVVPQGYQQVVQSYEAGTISEISVREGQEVQKDQKLLVLQAAGAQEDLARTLSKQTSFDLQEERLRAFIAGRKPDFSKYQAEFPGLVKDQQAFFDGMVQSRAEERNIVQEQIVQKQRMISALQAQLDTSRGNYGITKNLYERRGELNRKGYASDIQYLETKQNLNNIEGDIRELISKISVARSEIVEFQNRLQNVDAKYRDDANEKLNALMADKSQNIELISQTRDRVNRLEVRSPVHGIVKGLAVNTIGAVVQPGATLMEIVPLGEKLMVQVKIPPQHIGHVGIGQQVEMKFSSFDFARYGVVPGKLEQISASTFSGEGGERYYQGLITLDRNYAGRDPADVIRPGMTVMAEIITGRKTVLDYLLKPIHIAMKTAFTER